jgi:hypothetical protein
VATDGIGINCSVGPTYFEINGFNALASGSDL